MPKWKEFLEVSTNVLIKLIEFTRLNPDTAKWLVYSSLITGVLFIISGAITLFTFSIKSAYEAFVIITKQTIWFVGVLKNFGRTIQFMVWYNVNRLNEVLKLNVLWTRIAATATWQWKAALLANPITWIVIGLIAAIAATALLVKYWDKLFGEVTEPRILYGFDVSKSDEQLDWLDRLSIKLQNLYDDTPEWVRFLLGGPGYAIPIGDSGNLLSQIVDGLNWLGNYIANWVNDYLISPITNGIGEIAKAIAEMFKGMGRIMDEALSDNIFYQFLKGTYHAIGDVFDFFKGIEALNDLPLKTKLTMLGFGESYTGIPNEMRLGLAGFPSIGFYPPRTLLGLDKPVERIPMELYPSHTTNPSDTLYDGQKYDSTTYNRTQIIVNQEPKESQVDLAKRIKEEWDMSIDGEY